MGNSCFVKATLNYYMSKGNGVKDLTTLFFISNEGELPQYSKKQKQSFKGVLRKRCSENMQQVYRRKPMPKCHFNKVALRLLHGSSPVNFMRIFTTPSLKYASGCLLRNLFMISQFSVLI